MPGVLDDPVLAAVAREEGGTVQDLKGRGAVPRGMDEPAFAYDFLAGGAGWPCRGTLPEWVVSVEPHCGASGGTTTSDEAVTLAREERKLDCITS